MDVTIYSAFWCPDCREAKRFLKKHDIPFTEIDIETTPGAAEEVIAKTGKRAIPQLVIDGEWVQPTVRAKAFCMKKWLRSLALRMLQIRPFLVPTVHCLPYRGNCADRKRP